MWETHCHKRCLKVGYEPIPNWPSCYFHKRLQLLLTIYVDDFKQSGPKANLKSGWKLLESVLDLEDEPPEGRKADRYLGCLHEVSNVKLPDGKTVRAMSYNMEDYFTSIVHDYRDMVKRLTGKEALEPVERRLRRVRRREHERQRRRVRGETDLLRL